MSALQAANPQQLRAEFEALRKKGCSEDIAVERGAWRQFHLMEEGRMSANCDNCPTAAALLSALPVCDSAFGYAYFSVLAPGTTIAPHHGPTNVKLRVQLPLITPKSVGVAGGVSTCLSAALSVGG